ncbi:MAG: DM13 domain-containing protein [Hydrogenophaga sp.]|uniref:DM13 domain-containing protein n=1 Tax=Hydrogenophaga sp. TaxID=1904254 RepID=UPI001DBCA4BE|nr:DM13 domain-containing protein [Hydrogenophaga sp.]MBX3609279.1 DM13 domain-containing protein [Hydrogenophaga sp.]
MKRAVLLLLSHGLVLAIGFAAGIYTLPLLIAPPAPDAQAVAQASQGASHVAQFRRDLKGSDALHFGEGRISVGPSAVVFDGRLAPGPDYKLYLSPRFVETEAEFQQHKSAMLRVGDVKTFNNFIVELPAGVDLQAFNTVVVWCETFNEFISAAQYRE